MSYRTIVVGTDGSESSLRAVDRAAAIAAQEKAKLIIASAHLDTSEKGGWSRAPAPDRLIDGKAADSLGGAGYRMHGSASVYAILQDARERAKAAGAHDIESRRLSARQSARCCIWPRRSRRTCSSSATWGWARSPAVSWAPCPTPLPAKPKSTSSSSTPSDSLKRHRFPSQEAAKSVGGLNIRRQIVPMPSGQSAAPISARGNIPRSAASGIPIASTGLPAASSVVKTL